MSRKNTIEQVRQEFSDRGLILLDTEYKSNKAKMVCVDKDGYKMMSRLNSLKLGYVPNRFSRFNPYTIQNIKLWLKLTNSKYTLISTEYKSAKDKLTLNCPKHGEFKMNWGNLSQGQRCNKCGKISRAKKCRLTLKQVKENLFKINPNIEILSDEYINANAKLKCKCRICGKEWETCYGSLSSGHGCPNCNKGGGGGIGIYNPTLAERNKQEWLDTPAIVYTIECWNDSEHFYKIGITNRTVQNRFSGKIAMPYNYKILDEIYTNMYDATYIEDKLHRKHKEYSYAPLIDFCGSTTECFSRVLTEEVK